jgi:hypothetical protein
MGGTIVINATGNVMINGNLNITGDLAVSGAVISLLRTRTGTLSTCNKPHHLQVLQNL